MKRFGFTILTLVMTYALPASAERWWKTYTISNAPDLCMTHSLGSRTAPPFASAVGRWESAFVRPHFHTKSPALSK